MTQIVQMNRRRAGSDAGRANGSTKAAGAEHDRVEAMLTQALYMVGLYREILDMDETIIKRIRQLVATQTDDGDREGSLDNMRLILAQLEKIGQRMAYWNARLRSLIKGQLSNAASKA